jgi:hypothetical protein
MDLTFTTDISYAYTMTGHLSGTSSNVSANGGAGASLANADDASMSLFNIVVNAFGDTQEMDISENDILPAGRWRLRVNKSFFTETGADDPSATGTGSADFEFHLAPIVVAPALPLNISTRMQVGTEENVLIGGFIPHWQRSEKVIVRAIGPSLAGAGLTGLLQDPTLELHDSTGALLASNDNWQDSQAAEIIGSTIPPADDREAAIVQTLPIGAYTVIRSGGNQESRIGLVEVYDLELTVDAKLANISTRGRVEIGDNVMSAGSSLEEVEAGAQTSSPAPLALR